MEEELKNYGKEKKERKESFHSKEPRHGPATRYAKRRFDEE
jgi:hypothetical protein